MGCDALRGTDRANLSALVSRPCCKSSRWVRTLFGRSMSASNDYDVSSCGRR